MSANPVAPADGMEGLAATITEGYQTLRQVTCLEDVYDILDYLMDEVKDKYTNIRCKVDCAMCCKGLHPPYISAAEWELILYYINEFPQLIKDEIIRRARYYAVEYRDALVLQQRLIEGKVAPEEVRQTYQTLSAALKNATCPFLVMDKCGIYPVRPAKCRAMGNTLVQLNDQVKVHTCAWEISNFEDLMQKQSSRALTMPVWNVFEKVVEIINPPDSMKAVMPIWLLSHLTVKGLAEELDPKPKVML
ncbi:MAG: YkgJ family cysteine cluster protein [Candidatus Sericytochromatia bacterium]